MFSSVSNMSGALTQQHKLKQLVIPYHWYQFNDGSSSSVAKDTGSATIKYDLQLYSKTADNTLTTTTTTAAIASTPPPVNSFTKCLNNYQVAINTNYSIPTKNVTFAMWIYATELQNQSIFSVSYNDNYESILIYTEIGNNNVANSSITGYLYQPGVTVKTVANTNNAFNIVNNSWIHLAFAIGTGNIGSATGARFYINGQEAGQCYYSVEPNPTANKLYIGTRSSYNTYKNSICFFNGKIADFRIYNTALSADNIMLLTTNSY